ncbi:hypothetical protein [Halobaculum sp. EA56]|uniref:hypothetical protein n=1 Tax=Halobaculum sp. EA56 TaxID=3421648 RepID=UPI003EB9B561
MSWEYKYDDEVDETTIYWSGNGTTKSITISGRIDAWVSGCPEKTVAKEAVADMIQNAGTPERIRMLYDLNFGFKER